MAENAYEAELPGVGAGDAVTVRLEGGGSCGAGPDPRLLDAVPALRRPPAPGASVPRDVLAALPGVPLEAAARIAGGGDEITYWVVPLTEGDAPCAPGDRACVVPERDGRTLGAPACADADGIPRGEAMRAGPYEGRVLAYGLAPPGTERVWVLIDGRPSGGPEASDGLAAGLLREGIRWREGAELRFQRQPTGPGAGTVALLNGTTEKGLGAEVQGDLVERRAERLPSGGTVVGNAPRQDVERSEVLHLQGREWDAAEIAAALSITRVREVSREELADTGAPGSAVIAVLLGSDLDRRMR